MTTCVITYTDSDRDNYISNYSMIITGYDWVDIATRATLAIVQTQYHT